MIQVLLVKVMIYSSSNTALTDIFARKKLGGIITIVIAFLKTKKSIVAPVLTQCSIVFEIARII